MMKMNISCIIPFYNEGHQLVAIVAEVLKVTAIKQLILVDDGSTNDTAKIIQAKFPDITLISLPRNLGKAGAVKAAAKQAKHESVMMLDADLKHVSHDEINRILTMYSKSDLDTLLLKAKGGNNSLDRILRKDILFTGLRVLKTDDLKKAFSLNPKGYELEVAMNEYMIQNNKKVAWISTDIQNVHKSQKWGILNGYIKSIAMELSILQYLGLSKFINQIQSFAQTQLRS